MADGRPLVSLLLACYRQADVVGHAVRAALAQTYSPLEILISDDASPDATFERIEQAAQGYRGPHRITVRRNRENLGISAHFSQLAQLAQGELLIVAAGDDISEPQRGERLVAHWLSHGKKPDLIASDLLDIDAQGQVHAVLTHTHLDDWSVARWLQARPWLVGASHAWSKRLFDRFGPMQRGAEAEDQIMLLRALLSGGATTLHEPLVRWRRGGLSAKRRVPDLATLRAAMARGNRATLSALQQHLTDAAICNQSDLIKAALRSELARAQYTAAMLDPEASAKNAWQTFVGASDVALGLRLRLLGYTRLPWLYDPLIRLKAKWKISRHPDAANRPAL
ncbi:glycosyltransferase family 2 protein [Thiomonas sp.]